MKKITHFLTIALLICFGSVFAAPSKPAADANPYAKYLIPSAPAIKAKAYVLMDTDSGALLASKDMHERLPPASLTKLMTLYLTFRELSEGRIHLDDKVRISETAWKMGGSKMFVREGTDVPVKDLIQGIIVASGNDATTALAEYIGGTESTFVQMMNQQAQLLGMKDTHYTDATGLPHPQHYASAYDLALLARAVIHTYPQYYHFFSEKWFTWSKIKQSNRNLLLWRDPTSDGLKTGHTSAAGYCLIGSSKRGDMRLLSVVMGTASENARADTSLALLNYGFRFFKTRKLYSQGQTIQTVRVYYGENKNINVGAAKDVYITLPTPAYKDLKANTSMQKTIKAPIKKGQTLGELNVNLDGKTIASQPLVALQDDAKGGVWRRGVDWIASFF